uniref:Uncharacterized protein n=1 Tax=Panagrolaimus superbus TaxID=310955 RepID=A0A914Y3V3_9BILA
MLFLILFLNFVPKLYASFCGEGFMAFSLSVSFGGQFKLGCAQPSCLKFPIIESPTFAFVNGVKDGFVNLPLISEKTFINDRAKCETTFESKNCTGEDQWLAGIAPISDISNLTSLSLRCCKHWAMKVAKFEKIITIKNGENFDGGDIYDSEDEEVIAFDYITNIQKFDTDNGTFFEISVKRLPCNLESEEFSRNKNVTINNRIYQAPLVETGDYPAIEYDGIAENDKEETSTQQNIETDSDAISGGSDSYKEGNEYNINLTPPETADVPSESQTVNPTIETQTLANNPEISQQQQPQNENEPIQQQNQQQNQQPQNQLPQNQDQNQPNEQQNVQIIQTKDSYPQPGSSPNQQSQQPQQQTSYGNN